MTPAICNPPTSSTRNRPAAEPGTPANDPIKDALIAGPRGVAPGFATWLLEDDPTASSADLGRRAGIGLGLSALYGVALGARQGGPMLIQHALGVPLGLLLVVLLGTPSMFVFLSMCRAPIDAHAMARTAVRAVASAGLLLAGLAPAAALFVVSSQSPSAAAGAVSVGLLMSGGVALLRMVWDVARRAFTGGAPAILGGATVALGFAVFASALAARVWAALLPVLGGAA